MSAHVSQSPATSFHVRSENGLEWAQVFLVDGPRASGGYWGTIAIVSSFGTFGHTFAHMATPLIPFVTQCERDYLLHKLTDGHTDEFDPHACRTTLRQLISTYAHATDRADLLTAFDDAAEGLDTAEDLEEAFMTACPTLARTLDHQEAYTHTRLRPSVAGFSEQLLTPFLAHLRQLPATQHAHHPTFTLSAQDPVADFIIELWVHLQLYLQHQPHGQPLSDVLSDLIDVCDEELTLAGVPVRDLLDHESLPAPLVTALRTAELIRRTRT